MRFPFFKSQNADGTDSGSAASTSPVQSLELIRQRAKHRLIGAIILVLAGVVGFPLLFDTQPRTSGLDIPIVIPDKNNVKPLGPPLVPQSAAVANDSTSAASAPSAPLVAAASRPAPPAPARVAVVPLPVPAGIGPKEQIIDEKQDKNDDQIQTGSQKSATNNVAKPVKPEVPKPEPKAREEAKSVAKPVVTPSPKPAPDDDSAARARALLNGQDPDTNASAGNNAAQNAPAAQRYVVQVGAFADVAKAHETRLKVERGAGLKTYAQVVNGAEGKRFRIRVGPFASKAEADRAAAKIKLLNLPAAILTL